MTVCIYRQSPKIGYIDHLQCQKALKLYQEMKLTFLETVLDVCIPVLSIDLFCFCVLHNEIILSKVITKILYVNSQILGDGDCVKGSFLNIVYLIVLQKDVSCLNIDKRISQKIGQLHSTKASEWKTHTSQCCFNNKDKTKTKHNCHEIPLSSVSARHNVEHSRIIYL